MMPFPVYNSTKETKDLRSRMSIHSLELFIHRWWLSSSATMRGGMQRWSVGRNQWEGRKASQPSEHVGAGVLHLFPCLVSSDVAK